MKISTNFVQPVQQAILPITALVWLLTLMFASAAWWLIDDANRLRGEVPELQQHLDKLKVSTLNIEVPAEQMPSVQELSQTRERVAKINAATQTQGISILALLTELESQLPPQAWLQSLHQRAADGEILLVVAAATAGPLSDFLHKLERNPLFEQTMLMRELQPGAAGKAGVQYEIRLKVRS